MDRPRRTLRTRALALLAVLALMAGLVAGTVTGRAAGTREDIGVIGGAAYKIRVPDPWNGTLLLYSHGYSTTHRNPPLDAGDPATGAYLLGQGYALAGSDYSGTGWALEQAFKDQIALLNYFDTKFGHPKRTIAWGHSLGGIITAGLVQKSPERFAAALPMCGVLAGGVATWNAALDGAFAFKTLLAPDSALQLVNITNPAANLALARQVLNQAQNAADGGKGRARIALMASLADVPGWFFADAPEPAENDYAARQVNQYLWSNFVTFGFVFALRAELEFRAGGNPSWNTGVNYRKQLERSPSHEMVEALYETAGLSLEDDLARLEATPRIAAKPAAVDYLVRNIIFDGNLSGIPVLTLHTTGDGLVIVENEQAYASVVRSAGNKKLLREVFVHRAGHCTFTPAETITALSSLIGRLDSGKWGDLEPDGLNAAAAALGPLNTLGAGPVPPQFFEFEPAPYPRPFDSRALQGD